jgi:putative photosynthetic complex assembly protein 2
MGFITGPRTHACSERCGGAKHFLHAAQAVIYSDTATAVLIGAVYAATTNAPNRVGFWTLSLLWVMRVSAKLNLFFGVSNLGEAFLPAHLQYLRSFFRRRPMNFLFPISVTAGTLGSGALLQALLHATEPFRAASLALLLSLLALAVLEHWFMVLPLPSERLWSWAVYDAARVKRGRHTPRMMLASDSARSSHSPPHSVRSTSAN